VRFGRILYDNKEYYLLKDQENYKLIRAENFRNDNGLESFFSSNGFNEEEIINPKDVNITYLPPISNPGKIICIGRNFVDHIKELGNVQESSPILFSKYPSNCIGHNSTIKDTELGKFLDYEAELAIVISKTCYKLTPSEDVNDYIFGYTVANDLTYRDIQKSDPGAQWTRGKAFENSLPIGPYVITKDEIQDPQNLEIWLTINGEIRQNSNTKLMIFDIPNLIQYISQFTRLEAGDLILTGTPSGVGFGLNPPIPLQNGDEIACGVENICELRFRISNN
jgi:acylpyruvate hydrolase